jgi:hypothetical protein
MIRFLLDVEDLANTRFAISPLQETLGSLWALRDPGRYALHLPGAGPYSAGSTRSIPACCCRWWGRAVPSPTS